MTKQRRRLDIPMIITKADPVKAYLRYLKPYVGKENWIDNSKKIASEVPLSPRELLGMIIMCHVMNYFTRNKWETGIDFKGKDGVLVRLSKDPRERAGIVLEQTLVNDLYTELLASDAIVAAIRRKSIKGRQYAEGESLIVFCNKEGEADHRQLIEQCRNSTYDDIVLIIPAGSYDLKFKAILIKSTSGQYPIYLVSINPLTGIAEVTE